MYKHWTRRSTELNWCYCCCCFCCCCPLLLLPVTQYTMFIKRIPHVYYLAREKMIEHLGTNERDRCYSDALLLLFFRVLHCVRLCCVLWAYVCSCCFCGAFVCVCVFLCWLFVVFRWFLLLLLAVVRSTVCLVELFSPALSSNLKKKIIHQCTFVRLFISFIYLIFFLHLIFWIYSIWQCFTSSVFRFSKFWFVAFWNVYIYIQLIQKAIIDQFWWDYISSAQSLWINETF